MVRVEPKIPGIFPSLTSPVVEQHLQWIQSAKMDATEGLVIHPAYNPSSLSKSDLVSLYKQVAANASNNDVGKILLFDLTDLLLRHVETDLNFVNVLRHEVEKTDPLLGKLDQFLVNGSSFRKNGPSKPPLAERAVKVITCSVETERNPIGGVGFVVRGLNRANVQFNEFKKQNNLGPQLELDSLVPLYVKDKLVELNEAIYKGTVCHKYLGIDVVSSIYYNEKTGEYLVQPDPRFKTLFNAPLVHGAYSSNKTSDNYQRSNYLGSAFAAVCLQHAGKNGDTPVDVAQADYFWAGSVGFPLMQQAEKAPKQVLIMHHGVLGDRWKINQSDLIKCGVTNPPNIKDAMSLAMRKADKVVFVSDQLASMALSSDPDISAGRNEDLKDPSRVLSIRNGVDGARFDPSNEKIFKDLALKRTFDANGNETTDFEAHRAKIKQHLYQAGVIADPNADLIVNIGRFDYYKGTDVVRHALDRKHLPANTQFLVMGAGDGEQRHVARLKDLASGMHKDKLRIISTIEDQKKTLVVNGKDTGVSIGLLCRLAASAFFFPSHAEACPLIGMESVCNGAPIIVPSQKEIGFSLYAKCAGSLNEKGEKRTLVKDANSFGYPNHLDKNKAAEVLFDAISQISKMSKDERNIASRRISAESLREFSWFLTAQKANGATEVYGAVLAYAKLYETLAKATPLTSNKSIQYIPPTQGKISPLPPNPWTWRNAIPRIFRLFLQFLSGLPPFRWFRSNN